MRSFLFAALLLTASSAAIADQHNNYTVVIKDHKFEPAVVEVPAGQAFTLLVDNQDKTAEEFESHELKREKIIAGNTKAKIKINALKAGEYPFFGEFNEKTAQGKIIAK